MTKILTYVFLLIFSSNAFSKEHFLADIKSDKDKHTVFKFYVLTDAENVEIKSFKKIEYRKNIKTDNEKNYNLGTAQTKYVLCEKKHKKEMLEVISLIIEDSFNQKDGGDLKLRYLKNALKKTTENFNMKLFRMDGSWKLLDQNNVEIYQINLLANNKLFFTVGIKKIEINSPMKYLPTETDDKTLEGPWLQ